MVQAPAPQPDRMAAARAFARSLNIVLKHVRLYGANHRRTEEQLEQSWSDLQQMLIGSNGLLMGVAAGKLLLDGVPIETGPAEKSFAQMLNTAGISSIHFSPQLRLDEFQQLIMSFAEAKPAGLAQHLKTALGADAGIKINEVKFVAHDSGNPTTVAAELAAATLGGVPDHMTEWLTDPKKLLQLISAAEGAHSATQVGQVVAAHEAEVKAPIQEEDVLGVIRFLSTCGNSDNGQSALEKLTSEAQQIPAGGYSALYQALFAAASNAFDGQQKMPDLLALAEHLAIRFAVESYERGDVKYNVIHHSLERMTKELDGLRRILRHQEDKMAKAGVAAESHSDILDKQFWATVPDWAKRNVLLSEDSWCVPPRNIRNYIEQLIGRRDTVTSNKILRNYLRGLEHTDTEARRKAAIGLTEMADLFARGEPGLLQSAILAAGRQLSRETDNELRTLVSATFVRLGQEALNTRDYISVEQSMASLQRIETQLPNVAKDIRPRVTVNNRLREFVAEATRNSVVPQGLAGVLRRTPKAAAEELALQFSKSVTRDECARFVNVLMQLGNDAIAHLRDMFLKGSPQESQQAIALLSRVDMPLLLTELPRRLGMWNRQQQDNAVRLIAMAGSEARGELLMGMLDYLDPLILPVALDEVGFSGENLPALKLTEMASGGGKATSVPYLRIKAIEALARLRMRSAEPLVSEIVAARKFLSWTYPRELRVAAAQALEALNPVRASQIIPSCGLSSQELTIRPLDATAKTWVRQRRYPRVQPETALKAIAVSAKGKTAMALSALSLGGGLAVKQNRSPLGADAVLEMQVGLRTLRSHVIFHDVVGGVSFEIADISLDERSRLRKLISSQIAQSNTVQARAAAMA
ncbi:MAG TPA: hypothetical protein VKW78_14330 [Terriglobales bacterium]|nr:hypothetical protein [Terriglobales bacterium]